MNETKQNEPGYSGEHVETTRVESPSETTKPPDSSRTEQAGQFPKQAQATPAAVWPQMTRAGGYSWLVDFTKFLKRTQRVWLSVAGAIFGLMVVVTLVSRAWEWARNVRERRHEHAVATVTPDILIARCGQPAEDVTREVYPILMRTVSYLPKGNEKLVAAFSRTAEEKSDWVFLSMKDESGARSYDTSEAKIAALPCLDSKN